MSRYSAAVMGTHPVGYWRLGEASGTVAKDEMGVNNGAYVGAPTLGVAGLLTGDSDTAVAVSAGKYVFWSSPPLDISGVNPFSIAIWINHTPDATYRSILAICDASLYGVDITSQNSLLFVRRRNSAGQDLTTVPPLSAGTHLLVATYGSGTLRFFVDGAASGTTPASSRVLPAPTQADAGTAVSGTIDELDIWDRAITPAEIARLYQIGVSTWNRSGRLLVPSGHGVPTGIRSGLGSAR